MGFVKLVNDIDAKEAARMGLFTRPLTTAAVQKHLQEFGLEPEFGTHNVIRGLSGKRGDGSKPEGMKGQEEVVGKPSRVNLWLSLPGCD